MYFQGTVTLGSTGDGFTSANAHNISDKRSSVLTYDTVFLPNAQTSDAMLSKDAPFGEVKSATRGNISKDEGVPQLASVVSTSQGGLQHTDAVLDPPEGSPGNFWEKETSIMLREPPRRASTLAW